MPTFLEKSIETLICLLETICPIYKSIFITFVFKKLNLKLFEDSQLIVLICIVPFMFNSRRKLNEVVQN